MTGSILRSYFPNLVDDYFFKEPDGSKPPFCRELIYGDDGELKELRIQLAVAGYEVNDLEVKNVGGKLVISGDNSKNTDINHKFRCNFSKTFILADYLDVDHLEVELLSGLLTINIPVKESLNKKNTFKIISR